MIVTKDDLDMQNKKQYESNKFVIANSRTHIAHFKRDKS